MILGTWPPAALPAGSASENGAVGVAVTSGEEVALGDTVGAEAAASGETVGVAVAGNTAGARDSATGAQATAIVKKDTRQQNAETDRHRFA